MATATVAVGFAVVGGVQLLRATSTTPMALAGDTSAMTSTTPPADTAPPTTPSGPTAPGAAPGAGVGDPGAAVVASPSAAVPPAAVPPAAAPLPVQRAATYTVRPGDTLFDIAAWFMLHGFDDLYQANKATIGANPDLIFPGQMITLSAAGMTMGRH